MRQGLITVGVLGLALLAGPCMDARAAGADELLQRAEVVRRSDPKAFADTLVQLEQLRGVTVSQRQHLRYLKAYQLAMTGRYEQSMKQALALHETAEDGALKFRAALLVANTAAIARDFSRGLRYLEIALGQLPQVPDVDQQHHALLVAAVLYNQYGQYALAKQYAERVLESSTSPRNLCFGRQARAEALLGLGSSPLDANEVQAAVAECTSLRDAITANFLRTYLARNWAMHGEPGRAIEMLESHLEEVTATGYPRLIGEVHGLLAEYQLMVGNIRGAEVHARAAVGQVDANAYTLPLVAAHKVLYEVALRRGNLVDALKHYRSYANADKARMDDVKARELAFQLSRQELQQKNQAIELLQKQNEVLRLQQEVTRASARNTQLLLALLAIVVAAIAFWAYKIKRVQMTFRRQAEIDGLTGISNRRHFRQKAEALLQRCAGNGREAAMVLLDLDHFKRINDVHGHAIGDWVLQQVAQACQATCREGDVCGRLGGEEFAIVSCGSDMDAARRIAQRCREQLAAIDTTVIGQPVTASFGCATSARSGYAFEAMFAHADAAMYRAKASGRDRVRAYGEDGTAPATVLELVRG